ncbi:tyrosine kinase-like protein, putative [Plasmodium ovale]|uniref:Tyrosine kinase-like protein, putative n=1 Tax=Plasmodium ovale TaxID=36330 RepID=A0A1D3RD84_PLAOA|nr:tyrosine kinase-like protein, putative [Plasmodium ovale]
MGKRTRCENSYIKTSRGVFIGSIKDKKKKGWGIIINNNGNKYEGLFENDEKHLFGSELLCCLYSHNYKYKKKSGEENSEEEFEKGNICLHENRYVYIGNYKEGKKHGNGVLIDYNTYAMYSCIFLKNEIIYKDVLFSSVNKFPSKYEKSNFIPFCHDVKDEYEKENFVTNVDKNIIEEKHSSNDTSDLNEKNKKEKDIYLFIQNQYKYNIFSYINFYRRITQKMNIMDSNELFLFSKGKKESYCERKKKKNKNKKKELVLCRNTNEERRNYEKRHHNFAKCTESQISILGKKEEILPGTKEPEKNTHYKVSDNDIFSSYKQLNAFENISVKKNNRIKSSGKTELIGHNFNMEQNDDVFSPSEEANNHTKESVEMHEEGSEDTMSRNGGDNGYSGDSKRRGSYNTNACPLSENSKKAGNCEKEIDIAFNSLFSELVKDISNGVLKNLSNGEERSGREMNHFGKPWKKDKKKIFSIEMAHQKLGRKENYKINRKLNINFNRKGETKRGNQPCESGGRERKYEDSSFSSSNSACTSSEKKKNGGRICMGNTSLCIDQTLLSKGTDEQKKERKGRNAMDNAACSEKIMNDKTDNDGSIGECGNLGLKKHEKETRKHNGYTKGERNFLLKLKNDERICKEIECLLPKYLKKEKRNRCLSCAQNCIYWDVFEFNFFLFFIGIPKKVIEIFIVNQMDGYCLRYIERRLLRKMGIYDEIVRKYLLLSIHFLLRLREKYKYKKRSKRFNGISNIDSHFILKKSNIHFQNIIGRGGYSNVYRCIYGNKMVTYNDYFHVQYSINNIALKICIDKKYSYDFFSELKILSTLRHPNVSLFLGGIKSPQAIALEYVRCGSIFDLLHKHKVKIKIDDIIKMCKDITAFMCFLHYKGILHCDLKSSNILLSISGEIKICDFGLSVQNFYEKPKYLGIVGTYQWTAPEILRGEGYTQYADIYSFGVILWEMLHRKIPFSHLKHPLDIIALVGYSDMQLEICDALPRKIKYILRKCLHRDKRKRKSFFFWSEYFDFLHKTDVG